MIASTGSPLAVVTVVWEDVPVLTELVELPRSPGRTVIVGF
ncbi:hypothetical protein [Streptomyces sp. NBC_01408]|nr:hypothetical protein [Streptomyces sp. NBC_01408]MCX4692825.1 hypothetical protein [Streptomyces sp. NBC_01408]